ncbi:hypothetical protein TEA_004670 [Camellia sinensis var. sinensis]|uniref:beta-galactosidase n=1 Tax=Camellia sinensis var. sinensis TaxID=542762 RepID=A0A4S4DNI5_CAMSN|nr:hypothetical protein TEA_004670 [Camellia sinensis var. sinensis]
MNDCSRFLVLTTIILLYYCFSFSFALDVSYDEKALTIDGERKIIISGSIHYPRSTPEMWPSLIKKAKEGGLNAIETYVFWNAHEPIYRQYDFSENLDLVRFIRAIHDEGLYAILRIGPYVCAEWNYGGFPVWLHNIPGIAFRTNNEVYENEMKNFTTLIVDMVRDEGLFASKGGPIILAQYHGGTNFGRVSGGPYIATTYDYDAPLDEYGNLNQPKWGHLKQLHLLIRSMEDILTHAVIRNVEYGNMMTNYGDHFDEIKNGIHGPVKLMGDNNQVKDLQNSTWTYKVGIHGIDKKKLYMRENRYNRKWELENLPTDRMFVWYQTTFMAPMGDDPVVLDLLGLGKGIAWVNGHNIGRYWPSFFADDNGCDYKCDYRGTYSNSKCLSGCNQSSQRWYHVPRSFLQDDDNLLVLFEEFGGNPANLKIQTVTVGTICANAYEGNKLELSCQGGTISEIKFASYGNPRGSCGSFERGTCESPNTTTIIENACVGKESCVIDASEFTFPNNCKLVGQRLAVEAIC